MGAAVPDAGAGVLPRMQWAPLSRMLGRHERSLAHRSRPTATDARAADGRAGRDRRAAGQSRHAGRGRCAGGAPLSQGIPVRPAGDREPGRWSGSSCSTASSCRSGRASKPRTTRRSGTSSATNPRSRPSPARRRRSSPPRSTPLGRAHRGRLGDALRQSVDRVAAREPDRARLRAHPGDAALSAILRGHHRDGLRRGVPRADGAAPAADACASRAPYYDDKVYIEALASSMRDELGKLCVPARDHPRLVSTACRRSTSARAIPIERHCIETTRLLRDGARLRREQADADVPVALRPRQVARALRPTRPSRRWRKRGVKIARGGHARLLRRLPGDAGGDRGRERAHLPQGTAARISPRSRVSTTARRVCCCWSSWRCAN